MKTKLLTLFIMLLAAMTALAANKTTEVFTLDHQMSTHCEKKIKENLRFEKGITAIEVSLDQNTITITYNPAKTSTEKILKAFKKIGFNAQLLPPAETAPAAPSPCCQGAQPTACPSCQGK